MRKLRTAILVLGLVVCLQLAVISRLALGSGRSARLPADAPVATEAEPALAPQPQNYPDPAAKPQAETFRWAVLESTDYRTYVQNLRSIQCPEQTLRDIITADVDRSLYAAKRQKLQSQEQELAAHPLGSSLGRENLRREQQALWSEEFGLIDRLLGQESPGELGSVSNVAASSPASPPPVMPLAFAVSVTNLPGFNDSQRETVECFQRRFVMDLDGLDANSPEYAAKWQEAQSSEDALLKSVLGFQAYQKILIEASRQKLISATTGN